MDIWIIKETCLDRDYERIGIELQNGWTIIDIGAGLGDFSIYAADKSKQGKVYAFEPFPDSFKLLQENIELNGVQNVFPYQKALASKPGTLSLETGTGIAVMHSTAQTSDNDTRIQVPSVTLSQAFTENNLLHCDFLKIDCEGGEYDILMNGDKETLSKIKHICLEYHDGFTKHSHDDLVNFLQGNGFEVTTEPNPVHAITGILYARNNAPSLL